MSMFDFMNETEESAVTDATARAERRRRLLDVSTIYTEPAVVEYERGRQILADFPDAERIEVPSHNNIPGLYGNEGAVDDWLKIKRTVLVLGIKKSLSALPLGCPRSMIQLAIQSL